MVKTRKMELLRALVSECLSAAAEEIFKIVQRTIIEYEEEMSCSKSVVDSHQRLLDVAKSHSEDSLQMSATDVKLQPGQQQHQPATGVNLNVCWEEPENTISEPTEACPNMSNTHLDSCPASKNDQSDQEMLIGIEGDDVKPECDLNIPFRIIKGKKKFKCPICLSIFSSKRKIVRHIKKHPEDKSSSYQCQFRCFCHKSEFISHTKAHKASKLYKCQDCDKSFDQSLLIHRQKPTREKPYHCFNEKVDAEIHLRSVMPTSKIKEELDSKQDESGIKTFPLTVNPYDKSEFDQESLQPLCLYQIQTIADIDNDSAAAVSVDHIKTEPAGAYGGISESTTDDQTLLSMNPGEQCEGETEPKHLNIKNMMPRRPLAKSTELIVQFEEGTAQKPYKCPCCTKCFSLTKTLIRHVKIHTNEKPYQCKFCGRNFCQKSDLVNHTRIHTGERPYQCKECHKSFAQKGNLVVHMRKHSGEKPYKCQECSCSFRQKSFLDCHMQNHT